MLVLILTSLSKFIKMSISVMKMAQNTTCCSKSALIFKDNSEITKLHHEIK